LIDGDQVRSIPSPIARNSLSGLSPSFPIHADHRLRLPEGDSETPVNIPSTILTLLAGIVLTLLSLWVGQNNHLLPMAASDNVAAVDNLFNTMLTISIALFLLVQGLIIIAAIKFRKKPGDETDGPPIHGNIPLEILWTAIPAVLVLGVSIYSFQVYSEMGGLDPMSAHGHPMAKAQVAMVMDESQMGQHMGLMAEGSMDGMAAPGETSPTDPQLTGTTFKAGIGGSPLEQAKAPDLSVKVTAMQYAWIFNYPSGIISGELHIPANKDVQLNMSANDVLHAFWVPQFRLKQDVIPGSQTELRFTANVEGSYPIVCAELCGGYHGAMRSTVIVHSPDDYEKWQTEQLVAMANAPTLVAEATTQSSQGQFLEPYVAAMQMDIDPQVLRQLPNQIRNQEF
jgi:cytochrome c oxidase subunit II